MSKKNGSIRNSSVVWILVAMVLAYCFSIVVVMPLAAQEPTPPEQELQGVFPKKPPYSPYAGRNFPERVYWGDTHLHTSFSMDAGAFGCRLTPRDAYRFAKGFEITASSGQPARLARPLDFLVVADHSDGFGFFPLLFSGDCASRKSHARRIPLKSATFT
jgi:Protein of unknown function (DUF3604)